jgi:hypothetical protein
MSALPSIATKLVRRNEVTLCANSDLTHRSNRTKGHVNSGTHTVGG